MGDASGLRARVGPGARLRRALVAGSSLFVLAGVAGAAGAVAGAPRPGGLGHHDRAGIGASSSTVSAQPPPATESSSWSGEVAWASKNGLGAYSDVTGAWVQPAVAPSSSPQYADTWVGVDGYDGKLLQAGTTAEADGNGATYDAWFVAWTGQPSGMTVIDEPVAPGDRMDVTIVRQTTGQWNARVQDATAGWTWSTTVTYPANGSTAEWIEEAPGTWSTPSRDQTLADYGSVTFTTVRANGSPPDVLTAFDIGTNGKISSAPGTYDPALGSFTVRYGQPAATLQAITPPSGPASGGTVVQLTGANLGPTPVVRFGGAEATVIRSSTSSILVRTPPHAPGDVPVTVTLDHHGALAEAVASAKVSFDYAATPGYVVLQASGTMAAFGSAHGVAAPRRIVDAIVGVARDLATGGYWEATSGGGVYDLGAPDLGTLAALVQRLSLGTVTGIAAMPTGSGYWLVGADGGVFTFGAARFFGSASNAHIGSPIVGVAAATTDRGYWLAVADGQVLAFGAAPRLGSVRPSGAPSPAVGILAG